MVDQIILPVALLIISILLGVIISGFKSFVNFIKTEIQEFKEYSSRNDREHSDILMQIQHTSDQLKFHEKRITVHDQDIKELTNKVK